MCGPPTFFERRKSFAHKWDLKYYVTNNIYVTSVKSACPYYNNLTLFNLFLVGHAAHPLRRGASYKPLQSGQGKLKHYTV